MGSFGNIRKMIENLEHEIMARTPKFRPTEEDLEGTSPQNHSYHKQKGEIMDKLGGKCAECETEEYLEIHHIRGTDLPASRPGAERIRDWKEQLKKDNLLLLCLDCHADVTHRRPSLNMSRRIGAQKLG